MNFYLLLSILYLPVMLLIPCTFPPFSPFPLPADNPPCGLHFCDSVPVLVVYMMVFKYPICMNVLGNWL